MSTSPQPDGSAANPSEDESRPVPPAEPSAEADSKEDLPEREPLTPEDVEDEALRGDFMLRWATILLAFLIACTIISETETLVHIKSGQYTFQHGPARTGVFSSTAAERPWANLSWLFDALLAGVYFLGGKVAGIFGGTADYAITVFKALLAAVTFWFVVHTNRKGVSTWWGTVCALLALLVCFRLFTARPEIVTLLGIAITLRMLHVWRENPDAKFPKGLVILFFLWANLDPGMFFGLAVVVLYALGETLGEWLGYSGLENDARRRQLWLAVGACVAAALVNPFGWESLLAPVSRYTVEYPALRLYNATITSFGQSQFHPMIGDFWTWKRLGPAEISGLILLLTAPITFALNYRRLDFGHVMLWLGFTLLAMATLHELAAAALVAAVLATLNAQQWYQNTFRQTYSVETSELAFSRGGRAATVLVLFGMAYLAISGLLERRTGIGFSRNLQASIDGLREELEDSHDDRPFNFVLPQGDLLVWLDQKAFVDSRVGLYGGSGDEDLLAVHQETRQALRNAGKPGEAGQKWKPILDRYKTTHVLPRLDTRLGGASNPDYDTFLGLIQSPDWQLTSFGATTVVFYRSDMANPKLAEYLKSHTYNFASAAFREKSEPPDQRTEWARGLNVYERWLRGRDGFRPNPIEEARHYAKLFEQLRLPPADQLAMAYLVIRKANVGLAQAPQSAEGYWVLGRAYSRIAFVEFEILRQAMRREGVTSQLRRFQFQAGIAAVGRRRYRQAAGALQQALVIDGDNPEILGDLASLQHFFGKLDLAAANYKRCLKGHVAQGDSSDRAAKQRKAWVAQQQEVQKKLDAALKSIEQDRIALRKSENPDANRWEHVKLAAGYWVPGYGWVSGYGCIQTALDIMDGDPDFVNKSLQIALHRVDLLQQAGRLQDADESLQQMNAAREERARPSQWRELEAYSALCRANYGKARSIWQRQAEQAVRRRNDHILLSFPLAVREPSGVATRISQQMQEPWSSDQTATLTAAFNHEPSQVADLLLAAALTHLEAGDPQAATALLHEIGEIAPNAPVRVLVSFYLTLTTGKGLPPLQTVRPPVRAKKPG